MRLRSARGFDIVTFGETMLRLSPPGFGRLEEAVSLEVRVGGSESNTAVALARLGLRVAWFSKLPDSPLGRRVENEIRRWGVDTRSVCWDRREGARIGAYFLDFGVAPRATEVYYDRADSSVTRIQLEEINQELFESARLVHLTGITPALSEACRQATRHALNLAKLNNVPVSFDINYRAKLWTPSEAKRVLAPMLSEVTLLLCPQSDAASIFDLHGAGADIAQAFQQKYGVPSVIITCGGEGAYALDAAGAYHAPAYTLGQIVDRVGAGDAFNAGALLGFLEGDLEKGLRYGVAMAALKHTMPGDLLLASRAEIESALAGGSSGIRR